jgi:chromosome segregation ATPase
VSLHNDITCNHHGLRLDRVEEEVKGHDELIEWLVERVAGLEARLNPAPDAAQPLSEVPTVPRRAAAAIGLKYELDALRERVGTQEVQITDSAQTIETLRAELESAREELVNMTLERDRERAQANEWLVQLHDAKKELVRASSILEAIRSVTEELGFEMPDDMF